MKGDVVSGAGLGVSDLVCVGCWTRREGLCGNDECVYVDEEARLQTAILKEEGLARDDEALIGR